MPFALLMTDILRRREARDREKGYSKEYIQARESREVWYVLNFILAIAAIVAINWVPMGISIFPRTVITASASMVLVLSVWKLFQLNRIR